LAALNLGLRPKNVAFDVIEITKVSCER